MKRITSNLLIIGMQLLLLGFFLLYEFHLDSSKNKMITVSNDNIKKTSEVVANLFKTSTESKVEEIDKKEEVIVPLESVEEKKEEEIITDKVVPVVEEPAPLPEPSIDTSKYTIDTVNGFNVTTNNRTYTLTEDEIITVSKVVQCEALQGSYDDTLAVISVILNRADARGLTPVQVVSQAGQFSCYRSNNGGYTSAIDIVRDALNGVRNNNYHNFNCSSCIQGGVSIVAGGNRYY